MTRRNPPSVLSRCYALVAVALLLLLTGCLPPITHVETDYYTITDRDTTYTETVRNVPGSTESNGVVFPSSRTTEIDRHTLSHDSTYDRKYPAFLRLGGLEFAGLIGSSSSAGIGSGMFGLYTLFTIDPIDSNYTPFSSYSDSAKRPNSLFKGRLFRLMPYEYRLRWFDDAPNWTVGGSIIESIAPDEQSSHTLNSYGLNVYVRRRIYLRDRIPYLIFAPYAGVSAFPSAYLNAGGELQFGSYGGFNVRAYAGFASGYTKWTIGGVSETFPYIGIGVSALDFTNKVEETEREWKDYVHSAVQVEAFEFGLLRPSTDFLSIFDSTLNNLPFKGITAQLATVAYPLPILNGHLWAGTSLINYMAMGFVEQGIGILPVRVGYRQYIIAEDLVAEPFIEYNYYPSQFLNTGLRFKLNTFKGFTGNVTLGYTTGGSGDFLGKILNTSGSTDLGSWSSAYLGVSIGFGDYLDTPERIAEMRTWKQ